MGWQFFVICTAAAATDILWRKVPNVWLAAWFLTGLLLTGTSPAALPLGQPGTEASALSAARYLLRAAVVTAALYPAWRLGMTGAGDVKLCGLMAAWMGLSAFARCALYSLFLGGAAALLQMIYHHSLLERISYFLAWSRQCISRKKLISYSGGRQWQRRETIPYSAALLGGLILWLGG